MGRSCKEMVKEIPDRKHHWFLHFFRAALSAGLVGWDSFPHRHSVFGTDACIYCIHPWTASMYERWDAHATTRSSSSLGKIWSLCVKDVAASALIITNDSFSSQRAFAGPPKTRNLAIACDWQSRLPSCPKRAAGNQCQHKRHRGNLVSTEALWLLPKLCGACCNREKLAAWAVAIDQRCPDVHKIVCCKFATSSTLWSLYGFSCSISYLLCQIRGVKPNVVDRNFVDIRPCMNWHCAAKMPQSSHHLFFQRLDNKLECPRAL